MEEHEEEVKEAYKNPRSSRFKPLFHEDWGCAVLYFKANLAKIETILKLEKNLRESKENAPICRLLIEFSAVLLVSAFEAYCSEKIREIVTSRENQETFKIEQYNFQDPTDCNRAFEEVAGIEVLRVGRWGEPGDQDKLRRMKILFEKRHCIIHRNNRVSSKLRNMLNQRIAINAEVPLDEEEIMLIMDIVKEFVFRVESQYPSPVDWEELKL